MSSPGCFLAPLCFSWPFHCPVLAFLRPSLASPVPPSLLPVCLLPPVSCFVHSLALTFVPFPCLLLSSSTCPFTVCSSDFLCLLLIASSPRPSIPAFSPPSCFLFCLLFSAYTTCPSFGFLRLLLSTSSYRPSLPPLPVPRMASPAFYSRFLFPPSTNRPSLCLSHRLSLSVPLRLVVIGASALAHACPYSGELGGSVRTSPTSFSSSCR